MRVIIKILFIAGLTLGTFAEVFENGRSDDFADNVWIALGLAIAAILSMFAASVLLMKLRSDGKRQQE